MIYDQGDDGACAPLPSSRRRFWRRWISGAVMVVFGPLIQGLDHCSGTFFYVILLSFFWLCASIVPLGHYVVAEAGCNWYHLDINIYSLSKNLLAIKIVLANILQINSCFALV
jgi:hypothetical protein